MAPTYGPSGIGYDRIGEGGKNESAHASVGTLTGLSLSRVAQIPCRSPVALESVSGAAAAALMGTEGPYSGGC